MSILSRHGGPFGGPRLLIALFLVTVLFFWASRPGSARPVPVQSDRPDAPAGGANEGGPPEGSLQQGLKDSNSISDSLFDYLKDHTPSVLRPGGKWGDKDKDKADATVPHSEHAGGHGSGDGTSDSAPAPVSTYVPHKDKQCAHVPDTSDILVVMRVPAAELRHQTTNEILNSLRCVDHVIYSTVNQKVKAGDVHDALADVTPSIKSSAKDFDLYNQIQTVKDNKAKLAKLKEDHEHNLDKWAIIPTALKAYAGNKDKKWFLLIEGSTYVNLPNLVAWTKKLDASKAVYTGAQVQIQSVQLAQSGPGILLSGVALQKLAKAAPARKEAWERETVGTCCADKMLAVALKEAGVNLHFSFPAMQSESPFSLDWSPTHWCRAAVTWHKLQSDSITLLVTAEKEWYASHSKKGAPVDPLSIPPLRYSNIFTKHVFEIVKESPNRTSWDNLSDTYKYTDNSRAQYAHFSFEACRAGCDLREECLQYSWSPNKCQMGSVVRIGQEIDEDKEGRERALTTSGWMVGRIESNVLKGKNEKYRCEGKEAWILPAEDFKYESETIDFDAAAAEEERMRAESQREKADGKAKAEGEEQRKKGEAEEEEAATADDADYVDEEVVDEEPDLNEEVVEEQAHEGATGKSEWDLKAEQHDAATGGAAAPAHEDHIDKAAADAMKIWGGQR